MTTISKVRNEIRFTREDGKYWFIDINNNSMHGFSGKVVKRFPAGGRSDMENYIYSNSDMISSLLRMYKDEYDIDIIAGAERLMAAVENTYYRGNWYKYQDQRNFRNHSYTNAQLINGLRKMKEEWDNNHPYYETTFSWNFTHLIEAINKQALFGENGSYNKLVNIYGVEKVSKMYDLFNGYDVCKTCPNWLDRVFKYKNDSTVKNLVELDIISNRKVNDMIQQIFSWCSDMGVKLPKGDFIVEYGLLKNNYTVWKETAKQTAFSKVQAPMTPYANDKFVAIVPTTIEELVKEGNEQRNCIGGLWLNSYGNSDKKFARGAYFVRKVDSPDKAYITCDFDAETGTIQQYYYRGNTRVYSEDELNFKSELQKHIQRCLGIR